MEIDASFILQFLAAKHASVSGRSCRLLSSHFFWWLAQSVYVSAAAAANSTILPSMLVIPLLELLITSIEYCWRCTATGFET